ncbi:MAG: Smr/MutS family protein [Bacteroidetes bacterium]|nr:Smr/MutS family protein [Bacteroidota bacterium]
MKFEIGDKVLVLHSNEEGEVAEIINNKMVMVDVRGVKFPAYIDQLDFPYFKRFTEKKNIPPQKQKKYIDQLPKEKKERIAKVATGVWLTFLPVFTSDEFGDDIVETLKIHLVNNSQQAYRFTYRVTFLGKDDFELQNEILVFQDFYLHDIPFENLNDSPIFEFDFSLLTSDKKKAPHYEHTLKLKAKQVFARIEEIKQKGDATFSYKLFDQYPDKVEEEIIDLPYLKSAGYKVYEASKARQHLEPAKYELDLHIEKLSDDWKHLSNFEILTLQIQTLEKYIDLAIAHKQPSMIVIHGVGTGKLRDEIHEVLRLRREVKTFINQYDPRYGYGATEIFFQY